MTSATSSRTSWTRARTSTPGRPSKPWFSDNNVVTLWLNVTRAPLNDPKVRLAISAGIDRQQLSAQGETELRAARHLLRRPAAPDRQQAARLELRQ